jgi:nicotinamide N-methyltransferase/methyltransferase
MMLFNIFIECGQKKNTVGVAKKVLEVGSGPVPIYVISASHWSNSIVCSDFLEQNREKLIQWLSAGHEEDGTWLSYAHFVAQLESEK